MRTNENNTIVERYAKGLLASTEGGDTVKHYARGLLALTETTINPREVSIDGGGSGDDTIKYSNTEYESYAYNVKRGSADEPTDAAHAYITHIQDVNDLRIEYGVFTDYKKTDILDQYKDANVVVTILPDVLSVRTKTTGPFKDDAASILRYVFATLETLTLKAAMKNVYNKR